MRVTALASLEGSSLRRRDLLIASGALAGLPAWAQTRTITDGAGRASEAAVAALLVRLGVLDPAHPAAVKRLNPVQKSWRGFETGEIRTAAGFPG